MENALLRPGRCALSPHGVIWLLWSHSPCLLLQWTRLTGTHTVQCGHRGKAVLAIVVGKPSSPLRAQVLHHPVHGGVSTLCVECAHLLTVLSSRFVQGWSLLKPHLVPHCHRAPVLGCCPFCVCVLPSRARAALLTSYLTALEAIERLLFMDSRLSWSCSCSVPAGMLWAVSPGTHRSSQELCMGLEGSGAMP